MYKYIAKKFACSCFLNNTDKKKYMIRNPKPLQMLQFYLLLKRNIKKKHSYLSMKHGIKHTVLCYRTILSLAA